MILSKHKASVVNEYRQSLLFVHFTLFGIQFLSFLLLLSYFSTSFWLSSLVVVWQMFFNFKVKSIDTHQAFASALEAYNSWLEVNTSLLPSPSKIWIYMLGWHHYTRVSISISKKDHLPNRSIKSQFRNQGWNNADL